MTSGNAVGPVRRSTSTQCRLLSSIKKELCSSMKVTFPKFYELYKYKWPTGGTNVFLKIEGDLQAMRDVHHLASPPPSPLPPGLDGSFSTVDGTKELFYRAHSQHFYSWLMRMPWVQGSDSSLGVLLLHPHTLVMWSAEEESCHQSVPGPSEQGRSTGGSSGWPTFSLSQHL